MRHNGFTLVELLVVVTIIVILPAFLTPALDRAVEAAERAVCAARLHAWGVAISTYSLDHRRKLLSSIRHNVNPGTNAVYPNLAWARAAARPGDWSGGNATRSHDLSAEALMTYLPGTDLERSLFGPMWYCPANRAPLKESYNQTTVLLTGWFVADYAYFARADIWGITNATRPDDLTGRELTAGRIVMSDALYRWNAQGNPWWFNHGVENWSTHEEAWGGPRQYEPHITGTNRMTGDGAVAWRDPTPELIKEMRTPSLHGAWVSHGRGPNPSGDLNFY
jgi:prepilin-type N-terminal cleavage/methylation domain-containing protein